MTAPDRTIGLWEAGLMGGLKDSLAGGINRTAQRGGLTPLVENMMGAWGQRGDRLMAEFQASIAPESTALFKPERTMVLYSEGTSAEAWLVWWNSQRDSVAR